MWKCGACRQQFSVLAGTILQGNRVGVLTWVAVIAHLVENPQALPRDLADRFGITRETARNMRDRLARAARADPVARRARSALSSCQLCPLSQGSLRLSGGE